MNLENDSATGKIKISGDLRIDEANSLRNALHDCLVAHSSIVLDLAEVEYCDTASLQLLIATNKSADQASKPFEFSSISDAVADVANSLGVKLVSADKAVSQSKNGDSRS